MNKELITKNDYEILGIKENAKPEEINLAYEKLLHEYHPEKIKLEKYREPNDLEVKKYQEIEKVYQKFDLKHPEWKCCGFKKDGSRHCTNMFYPCLWKKVEGGQRKYYCSQECYNSKEEQREYMSEDELIKKWQSEDAEWRKKKFEEMKKSLEKWKLSHIRDIERELNHAQIKVEDLEPNNRNYEQEINAITIKNHEDQEWISKIGGIYQRVNKDIWGKSKRDLQTCDHCQKSFKGQWDEKSHGYVSYGAVGKDGHYTFCSEECREKGMKGKWLTAERKNVFAELLKWMEKERITNISVDPKSGKLVIEYGKNNTKTIADDNLTPEQKEIKEFFRQTGKQSLSQQEVREEAKGKDKNGDNKWLGPVVGIGIAVLVIGLIGVIIYKSKKKD